MQLSCSLYCIVYEVYGMWYEVHWVLHAEFPILNKSSPSGHFITWDYSILDYNNDDKSKPVTNEDEFQSLRGKLYVTFATPQKKKKKKWKGVIGHFVNLDPRPQNSIDTAKVKDNIL